MAAAIGENGMMQTQQAWDWLRRELDRWQESGRRADFWWRDDDAVAASAELEHLLKLSEKHHSAVSLAVIPAQLQAGLSERLQTCPQVSVLQHGYSHSSHAAPGMRKLELGGNRDSSDILADLGRGFEIMQRQFDNRFTPVLVPPWNRIEERVTEGLAAIGFSGISTMRVRRGATPAPGLLQVNTHLDPINWRHRRGFIGVFPALAILIQHLVARRSGYRDIGEPTGILSHHLVQNDAVWRFLDDLLGFLREHPAVNWVDANSIWNVTPPAQRPG